MRAYKQQYLDVMLNDRDDAQLPWTSAPETYRLPRKPFSLVWAILALH